MLKIFTDGGARGNPGPAACAFVVADQAGNLREKRGKYLGTATNNEAEYQGVIEALSYLSNLSHLNDLSVEFFLDSELIVNQINGLWKVKEPRLRELLLRVREAEAVLVKRFPSLVLTYSSVPRAQNQEADTVVNEVLDTMG